jgi:phosphate transport system permease protein
MEENLSIRTKGRIHSDTVIKYVLTGIAFISVAVILFIILFLVIRSADAFNGLSLWDFFTGTAWAPEYGLYGAIPLILATVLVTVGAILFALPVGLGAAIYIAEVAPKKVREILKPVCEVLAGVPSIVYGFFGMVVIVKYIQQFFGHGYSWLAASIVLGIMALPIIISVSEDAMRAVPVSYREASMSVGATKWETTRKIVIPAAASGIAAATVLGLGRAMGETMAVIMVAGNTAIIPEPLWNIFSPLRTLTATIAQGATADLNSGTFISSLFLLGLVLMLLILLVNVTAKFIINRSRRKFNGERVMSITDKIPGYEKIAPYMPNLKRSVMLTLLFFFVMMISSLVMSNVAAAVSAFAAVLAATAFQIIMKRIGAANRQKVMHTALLLVVIFVVAILVWLIGDVVYHGLPALSWSFLTSFPAEMGIYPAIIGTLELIGGTMLIAFPLGIFTGIYLAEYAKNGPITKAIREAIDILNATPSVVYGLFGLATIVMVIGRISLIAGCVTLALMILPMIIRTTEETVIAVPQELREGSLAMGATKWQTVTRVVLPAAFGGVITGLIISIGRAAGETAPIMFTAAVGSMTAKAFIFDATYPVMALPYQLYYVAWLNPSVQWTPELQYGIALVLLLLVLSIFSLATLIRYRYNKKMKW